MPTGSCAAHLGAHVEEPRHQRDRRWPRACHRLSGLKGEAEPRRPSCHAGLPPAGGRRPCGPSRRFAVVVDGEHRLDDAQLHVMIERDLHQRAGILREAGAAEAGPGMQEFSSRCDCPAQCRARDFPAHRRRLFSEKIGDPRLMKVILVARKRIGPRI